MEIPTDYLSKFSTEERKVEFEFQALGLEMEPYYGKAVWGLFYKHPVPKIRDAHKIAIERGHTELAYLIGILKKL